MNNDSLVIYIIAVLCLGGVLILMRDRLEPKLRRPLALAAVVMIAIAFVLVVIAILNAS
ncbi:hypothetical protein [Paenibacillus glufosinatiresistens]|uniref:hypothetical protein n=1 Tax=Paenibacillus glufosinatiresistens TaxID=3070657 RepID=UPI00286EB2C1|nr:hypothetical protein [Paenibacillus sp. YX.27]